ncbi:ankyrin repeat protein [Histomonas meleagridis]|uniref:ankyrin repeat protein n=1 Tax=Histomonas meleagridis TaxID=135588 RepID=UPI003559499C|nr:ankyrin repeat protein [Histomonas meleagridis]KAH0804052.1 ankyrin repeat protein [Histomonas meleagridis]
MSGTLVCPYFDQLLQFLIAQLTVSGVPDPNFLILKRNIIKLFITLCTLFYPPITPDESEIRINYSQHFKCDISPHLIESLIKLFSFETDRVLLSSTLYILYQYVKHKIGPTDFVTPDFLKFIIPIARLAPDDLYDIESSPLQFLAFNYSYTCNEVRTIRNSIASFIGVILTNDAILDYLYDFLLSPTVDPFDFEGRIYLMTKYVKATMTNLGPMIEPDVVQVLGCETLKVDQHPSFVITSLLMFMSSILPYLDPKEGCTLAAKCILQSDEPIILCSASKLLRKSIIECDTRIELPIVQIIPKLLMLANTIRYKYLSTSVEALIQIGGPAVYPFINDTISGLLTICNQSLIENNYKNASSMLYSIFEIINAIPDDAQILEQKEEALGKIDNYLGRTINSNDILEDKLYDFKECIVALGNLFIRTSATLTSVQSMSSEHFPPVYSKPFDFEKDLYTAISNYDLRSVQFHIERLGVDPDTRDLKGNTILHIACSSGDILLVEYLIEKAEANPKLVNVSGETPIVVAANSNHMKIVQYLSKKMNIKLPPQKFEPRIHKAAATGDLESVKFLIEEFGVYKEAKSETTSETPLATAIRFGQLPVVQYLIEEQKVNKETTDSLGDTPLHVSCETNKLEIAKYLIEKLHVDHERKNFNGKIPLLYAWEYNSADIVLYLLNLITPIDIKTIDLPKLNKKRITILHWAGREGLLTIVKYLVEKANVNTKEKNINGQNALLYACKGKHEDVIKYLAEVTGSPLPPPNLIPNIFKAIKSGDLTSVQYHIEKRKVNPNKINRDGDTLLIVALRNKQFSVVQYLIEKAKADIEQKNNKTNETPLIVALESNNKDIIQYMCNLFKIELPPENFEPDIFKAIENNNINSVKYFIEKAKFDPQLTNRYGENSIFEEYKNNHNDVIKYLADLLGYDLPPEKFVSNIYKAIKIGDLPSVQFLVEVRKSDPDFCGMDGDTPLILAIRHKHLSIVKYLVEKAEVYTDKCNNKTNETPLIVALESNNKDIIQYMCNLFKIELPPENFEPDIFKAIEKDDLNSVKYLIEKAKFDTSTINSDGKDLLTLAYSSPNVNQYFQKMFNSDAFEPVLERPRDFENDIFKAIEKGKITSVQYSVEKKKANIKTLRNSQGNTLLNVAVLNGQLLIVKYLVGKCGMDVNLGNKNGHNPLHIACQHNQLPIINYLLKDKNININFADKAGNTPLHWASKYGRPEAVKMLLQHGANKNALNNAKKMPIDLACKEYGYDDLDAVKQEIIDLLLN